MEIVEFGPDGRTLSLAAPRANHPDIRIPNRYVYFFVYSRTDCTRVPSHPPNHQHTTSTARLMRACLPVAAIAHPASVHPSRTPHPASSPRLPAHSHPPVPPGGIAPPQRRVGPQPGNLYTATWARPRVPKSSSSAELVGAHLDVAPGEVALVEELDGLGRVARRAEEDLGVRRWHGVRGV